MAWNIVFVDDDAGVLEALQRMLRSMRREWRMHFFTRAEDALVLVQREMEFSAFKISYSALPVRVHHGLGPRRRP